MSVPLSFLNDQVGDAGPRIGMAPLVDIVLLLICFYLLVMQSMQARTDDQIILPMMANNQTSELTPAELIVNITAEGVMSLNGLAVEPRELRGLLQREQQRVADTGQGLNVVLRADGRQRYRMLDAAMKACREAGLSTVTIRATEGRPK